MELSGAITQTQIQTQAASSSKSSKGKAKKTDKSQDKAATYKKMLLHLTQKEAGLMFLLRTFLDAKKEKNEQEPVDVDWVINGILFSYAERL